MATEEITPTSFKFALEIKIISGNIYVLEFDEYMKARNFAGFAVKDGFWVTSEGVDVLIPPRYIEHIKLHTRKAETSDGEIVQ